MSIVDAIFGPPVKKLLDYTNIPNEAVVCIQNMVAADEGGWVLEEDPNDSDGGWTFGGITANTFKQYYPTAQVAYIKQWTMQSNLTNELIDTCICIYYRDYYLPVVAGFPASLLPSHLSCAVNCGTATAVELLKQGGNEAAFLGLWKDHYFSITRANPGKLEYLRGWLNRVWKYAIAYVPTAKF
jgi:Glycosyl hydrolase 108